MENMDTKVRKERDNEIIADFRLGIIDEGGEIWSQQTVKQ